MFDILWTWWNRVSILRDNKYNQLRATRVVHSSLQWEEALVLHQNTPKVGTEEAQVHCLAQQQSQAAVLQTGDDTEADFLNEHQQATFARP